MTNTSIPERKSDLRAALRAARGALDDDLRERWNQAINQEILSRVSSLEVAGIAGFWPFDGEPDITPALHALHGRGVDVALPVLERSSTPHLALHAWQPGHALRENHFGIQEPRGGRRVGLQTIGLILMPLVGYDARGRRLGMGAGYYDRLLEPVRHASSPRRVGVAFAVQETGRVPRDDWDIDLHALVNENGWFSFAR